MDPVFHELFQSLGFLIGTWWLYRFIKVKHEAWSKELRAFRTAELTSGERPLLDAKVVTDRRLGRLGLSSIWCDHPGSLHDCILCKRVRQWKAEDAVKPAIPPPPPIYPNGTSRPNPGYVAFQKAMRE
jgi:hypothetical protein